MLRAACYAVLGLTVLYPFGALFIEASAAGAAARELAADPAARAAAARTFVVSLLASFLATAVGALAGRLSARYRFPGRGAMRAAAAAPFVLSHTVLGVAWVLLVDASSDVALTFVTALALLPMTFLASERLFGSMDAGFSEAARLCGATPARAFLETELPLALPGLASALALGFMLSNAMLGLHAVLAWPSGKGTLTRVLYDALSVYPFDPAAAALISVLLVLVGAAVLAVQGLLSEPPSVGPRFRRAPARTLTGRPAAAAAGFAAILVCVTVLLPVGALLARAASGGEPLALADAATSRAFMHSLLLAAGAAGACAAVGSACAFLGGGALTALCTLPYAFSGVVLGAAFIIAFAGPPLALHGTLGTLALAYFVRELPLAHQSARSGLARLSPELGEQAALCGASSLRAAREILWPLARPFIAAGAALAFMASFREIEASALLAGPGTEVFGSAVFESYQKGEMRRVAVLALIGAAVALAACAPVLAADRREDALD